MISHFSEAESLQVVSQSDLKRAKQILDILGISLIKFLKNNKTFFVFNSTVKFTLKTGRNLTESVRFIIHAF